MRNSAARELAPGLLWNADARVAVAMLAWEQGRDCWNAKELVVPYGLSWYVLLCCGLERLL